MGKFDSSHSNFVSKIRTTIRDNNENKITIGNSIQNTNAYIDHKKKLFRSICRNSNEYNHQNKISHAQQKLNKKREENCYLEEMIKMVTLILSMVTEILSLHQ